MKKYVLFLPIFLIAWGAAAETAQPSKTEMTQNITLPLKGSKGNNKIVNNITIAAPPPAPAPVARWQNTAPTIKDGKPPYQVAPRPYINWPAYQGYYSGKDAPQAKWHDPSNPPCCCQPCIAPTYANHPQPSNAKPPLHGQQREYSSPFFDSNQSEPSRRETYEWADSWRKQDNHNEQYESYESSEPRRSITWENVYVGFYGAYNMAKWTYKIKEDPNYSAGSGEATQADKPFSAQFGAGVVAGMKWSNNWKTELEIGYLGETTDNKTFEGAAFNGILEFSESAMFVAVNAIYQFPTGIYAGAGVGGAKASMQFNDIKGSGGSTTGLMGQILAGYETEISKNTMLDIGVKAGMYQSGEITYPDISNITMELGNVMNLTVHAGLRFYF
jgi:hypothetical protein